MSDYLTRHYPEFAYGGYTNVDGSVTFLLRVRSLMTPQSVVLDIGCGPGLGRLDDPSPVRRNLHDHRGFCAKVIGIDPDPAARDNPTVHEFRLMSDLKHWPVESSSIDVAYSDFVLEHVDDVDAFCSECHRVLKPGGYLCLRTPNLFSYFGFISWMVPNKYHGKVVSRLQRDRPENGAYPTWYRCNTRRKIRRTLRRHGFEACIFAHEPEPAYFGFSRVLYSLAVLHQKLAPPFMRVNLMAFARKVGPPTPTAEESATSVRQNHQPPAGR
jgi:SAM-dependent methyltransferase